jgi:ribonuclease BN (tRNA processing enzyme)
MKIKLLPTSIDSSGCATSQQHLCCFVVDDIVSIDAGSLATSTTPDQKRTIRDIVLTHAHLDHIAGLPLFIDDLFLSLREPIRVHALKKVVEILETDVFNWRIYPRFSELQNGFGKVLEYKIFSPNEEFKINHLSFKAIEVNHKVPSVGLIINDGKTKVAITGDTTSMYDFWDAVNLESDLSALLIECAFPDELSELAANSYHLTPSLLKKELEKFKNSKCPVYAINLKPMYREKIVAEIEKLGRIKVLEIGKVYEF